MKARFVIPAIVLAFLAGTSIVSAQTATTDADTLSAVCTALDGNGGFSCSQRTTTTTIAPTTTSADSTTSTAATTTTSTSSTTTSTTMPPTTTTTPSSGSQFQASLETPQDFFGRFVTDVGNYVDSAHDRTAWMIQNLPWIDTPRYTYGDHDPACEGPDTFRQLDNADPDLSKYTYWCAPGGAGTGHVMTAFDATGYFVVSFSPNQTMNNVQKVCFDINATEEGGGKWTNMVVVPEALYQQFAPRMDYVYADFNNQNAPGDFNIQQDDHPATQVWGIRDHRGGQYLYQGADVLWSDITAHTTTDKMARYTHCIENTGPNTSHLMVNRPDGTVSMYDLPSAIPQGPVRIIFQDESYDPPKRVGYDDHHITSHWDNVVIT